MNLTKILASTVVLTVAGYGIYLLRNGDQVDYSTEVKPILNKRCISCHGGVKKQGGFSVLFKEEALAVTESGKPSIIPGDPDHSEFITRLTSKDPEERMPYKEEAMPQEEIEILRKWVKQGANWGEHWAFSQPQRPDVPGKSMFASVFSWFSSSAWEKNDIDYFVSDRLEKESINHANQAEKATLLRRVCLDLTGLPPTSQQLNEFLADNSANAYEKMVDKLLASPRYGERWAGMWLDLARFSDTKGYEKDEKRNIWKYRDYVIEAFNKDLPYNQFIKEQLAGDLLPNPTDEQLIATAFHRNTMNNDEGGTDDEEFRNAALVDRVNTTWEVLQGTTFACVQCHSHPYDPIRHEEYYQYMAFFNNTRDEDVPDDSPFLRQFKPEEKAQYEQLKNWIKTNVSAESAHKFGDLVRFLEPKVHPHWGDQFINGSLADNKYLGIRNGGSVRFKELPLQNKTQLLIAYGNKTGSATTLEVHRGAVNGPIVTTIRLDTTQKGGWTNSWDYKIVPLPAGLPAKEDWFLTFKNPKVKPDQSTCIVGYFIFMEDFPGKGKAGYAENQARFISLLRAEPENTTPILLENPTEYYRKTHLWERGNWTAKTTEVHPAIPAIFGKLPDNAPKNRLSLANWMGSNQNPLTARVAVNRFWEQLFGTGLVETQEDFGTQGFTPSYPELMDYLSVKFMDDFDWQPKKLLKYIVMSATYQQDSRVTPDLREKDPMNRLLARGPRVRLSAEQVRDQALLVSGLLSDKLFGPSVMPYQPEGLWANPYSGLSWKISNYEDQHRRALYTFWRRTSPYPSMITFDGASREVCLARRIRTNTPLQALVTMNDPVYVECAINLAKKMEASGNQIDTKIEDGYRLALSKEISPDKKAILLKLYQTALANYRKSPNDANKLLNVCPDDRIKPHDSPQLAALTMVASTILNLDEFITKE